MMMRRGMEAEVRVQPSLAATKHEGRREDEGSHRWLGQNTRGKGGDDEGDARVNYTSSFFILL